jgi:ABC-2 type transport system permease protein
MNKYTRLFSTHFASAIEYRASLVGTLLQQAVSVASVVVLWAAVYRAQNSVAGYDFGNAMAYYLLVPVVGFMTQIVLSDTLSLEIRTGFFSNYLLKPLRFWLTSLIGVLAGKLNYLLLVSPISVAILAYLSLSGAVHLSFGTVLPALAIAALALAFHFVLDLAISFGAFWLDDVWAFSHIKNILFSVLGGLSFPLDFVSGQFRHLLDVLPFQYLYYVPISYLSGKRSVAEMPGDIAHVLLWMLIVIASAVVLWHLGLRKYGAYGR